MCQRYIGLTAFCQPIIVYTGNRHFLAFALQLITNERNMRVMMMVMPFAVTTPSLCRHPLRIGVIIFTD